MARSRAGKSGKSGKPGKPGKSGKSGKSGKPGKPGKSGKSGRSSRPGDPARPGPTAGSGRRGPGARRLLVLAAAAAGLAAALIYAAHAAGTYQDDDLDRYYMALQLWHRPSLLLDRWGMPLALAVLAIPAKLSGYAGVKAVTAAATAGAALCTGLAAESAGLAFPWLAAVFVAFQPMVLNLSYSGLAEPWGALVLAALLWAWYADRPDRALVLAGLLPLARIESGLLTLVVLAVGWRRSTWRGKLGAVLPAALWNLIGFAMTGQPLYVFALGGSRPLNSLGVLQYARNDIVTAGPIVLFFFLWALVARLRPARDPAPAPAPRSRFPALAAALLLIHLALLTLLAWDALPFGRSVGFLRHVVGSAPAMALVAAWGAGDWASVRFRPRLPRIAFAGAWTAVTALWLSHVLLNDSWLGAGRVERRWVVTAALAAIGVALLRIRRSRVGRAAVLLAGAGAVAFALAVVRPIGLDPERQAVQEAVREIDLLGLGGAVVYTNHPWFAYFSGRDRYDQVRTPHLTRANLAGARPGSVVIWENHYGPRLWGDVPDTLLRNDPGYRRLLELRAGRERNFHLAVFEKIR